jgi:hypothetical protein
MPRGQSVKINTLQSIVKPAGVLVKEQQLHQHPELPPLLKKSTSGRKKFI